jgi:hypothetical protein
MLMMKLYLRHLKQVDAAEVLALALARTVLFQHQLFDFSNQYVWNRNVLQSVRITKRKNDIIPVSVIRKLLGPQSCSAWAPSTLRPYPRKW